MDVGLQMVFATYGCPPGVTDQQCYDEELAIAEIAAEGGGMISVWPRRVVVVIPVVSALKSTKPVSKVRTFP